MGVDSVDTNESESGRVDSSELNTHRYQLLDDAVRGRVFERFRQYHLLPANLKLQADAVCMYLLTTPKVREKVFRSSTWRHRHAVGPCAKGEVILKAVEEYLSRVESIGSRKDAALQISEALLLSGMITPIHEEKCITEHESLPVIVMKEYYELMTPVPLLEKGKVDRERVDLPTRSTQTSVWKVCDGALRAGFIFRVSTHGPIVDVLCKVLTCGASRAEKKCYAVLNQTRFHALFFFASDIARKNTGYLKLDQRTIAQYSTPSSWGTILYHGIKLSRRDGQKVMQVEQLDFVRKALQDAWMLSVLQCGARYQEVHLAARKSKHNDSKSAFYDLEEYDAIGNFISMKQFAGKVLLLVNVATRDPQALVQFRRLVELALRYQGENFQIIAFPCRQFGKDLEYGSIEETVQACKEYEVCFPVMQQQDVNGPFARPLFIHLNRECPGPLGAFTEWNFTKFLVDSQGIVRERYASNIPPTELVDGIVSLLEESR
uniref:Glutathione peroxidase n=1 Tax=Albugo laibachii Nc14 TaxID=890382 RepID=F0W744_9STRA|nr:phospholipid hydroperoxide glutathione peroxidase pu [Albugo laibachii Nc14]|eukprot:CCA16943.1 phospholipid hydroperoxide glutathione peroxidase pu [Albugo laibachii Nc14]